MDIMLGVVGGFLFNAVGGIGVTGSDPYSMVVAVVVLWLCHTITGRRALR